MCEKKVAFFTIQLSNFQNGLKITSDKSGLVVYFYQKRYPAESGSFPQRMIYVLVYNKYLTSQIGLCSLLYTGSILLSLISNFSIFAFVGSV